MPSNDLMVKITRPRPHFVPTKVSHSKLKYKIAQALPYRTFHRASFLHGEIDDAEDTDVGSTPP